MNDLCAPRNALAKEANRRSSELIETATFERQHRDSGAGTRNLQNLDDEFRHFTGSTLRLVNESLGTRSSSPRLRRWAEEFHEKDQGGKAATGDIPAPEVWHHESVRRMQSNRILNPGDNYTVKQQNSNRIRQSHSRPEYELRSLENKAFDLAFASMEIHREDTLTDKSELSMEKIGKMANDSDNIARTAAELLDSVSHDASSKFTESTFLALMRRLRDKEARVEGNDLVEGVTGKAHNAK